MRLPQLSTGQQSANQRPAGCRLLSRPQAHCIIGTSTDPSGQRGSKPCYQSPEAVRWRYYCYPPAMRIGRCLKQQSSRTSRHRF